MRERRFKRRRTPRCVFLVICEGETEKVYIEALKHYFRLPITIKTKISGNKISARLVNQYLKELDLDSEDACRVFYVYDADIDCIVDKLSSLPGTMILTNPCIELWYMLHYESPSGTLSSDGMIKALAGCHPVWRNYTKGILSGEQFKGLMARYGEVVTRAKKLACHYNPSSNMYDFIEALEKCSKS